MTVRLAAVLPVFVIACGGEQSFSGTTDQNQNETGVTSLSVEPAELIFEDLDWEAGYASSLTFKVTNAGENNLMISTIGIANSGEGAFYMDESETDGEFEIAPGIDREWTVVATLTTFEVAEGEARVVSNDAENRDFRIPLTAYPRGWKAGDDTGTTGDDTGTTGDDTGTTGDDTGTTGDDTGTTGDDTAA